MADDGQQGDMPTITSPDPMPKITTPAEAGPFDPANTNVPPNIGYEDHPDADDD